MNLDRLIKVSENGNLEAIKVLEQIKK